MVDIAFTGIGSGVQVSEIVNAIVSAERTPFESSAIRRQAAITTDISAIGSLRGGIESVGNALASLSNADNYQRKSATGADEFISVSSTSSADVGAYSVNVDQLASDHKLVSSGISDSEAVGEGTLTLSSGSNSFAISVSNSATLADIRDAINDSDENESINATIITDDDGQHLVLTSKETGVENAIKVVVDDTSDANDTDNLGLSRLAYDADIGSATYATNLSETQAAQDAQITIDGSLVVTNSTNEFVDAIDGVTINAKKVHGVDDSVSDVSISANNNIIQAGLEQFVTSYNELVDLSDQLGRAGSDGGGPLAGDALLRGVMNKLRQQLSASFSSSGEESLSLHQLGIHTDRFGKISLDSAELNEQIEKDIDAVQNFFIGSDSSSGFAETFQSITEDYTGSSGIIQGRIDSKNNQLSRLDSETENFNRRIADLETRLLAQYNAMDLLVSGLNSTSSYLQQQLSNLPGVVKSNS